MTSGIVDWCKTAAFSLCGSERGIFTLSVRQTKENQWIDAILSRQAH
jgi:hypothetical protein